MNGLFLLCFPRMMLFDKKNGENHIIIIIPVSLLEQSNQLKLRWFETNYFNGNTA
jgi:hypothetical protein